jgi:hypothetical protein
MNHSICTADKATRLLKVVISALLASIAIVATTLTARLAHPEMNVNATAQTSMSLVQLMRSRNVRDARFGSSAGGF